MLGGFVTSPSTQRSGATVRSSAEAMLAPTMRQPLDRSSMRSGRSRGAFLEVSSAMCLALEGCFRYSGPRGRERRRLRPRLDQGARASARGRRDSELHTDRGIPGAPELRRGGMGRDSREVEERE